jgi:hypothetical protein
MTVRVRARIRVIRVRVDRVGVTVKVRVRIRVNKSPEVGVWLNYPYSRSNPHFYWLKSFVTNKIM